MSTQSGGVVTHLIDENRVIVENSKLLRYPFVMSLWDLTKQAAQALPPERQPHVAELFRQFGHVDQELLDLRDTDVSVSGRPMGPVPLELRNDIMSLLCQIRSLERD